MEARLKKETDKGVIIWLIMLQMRLNGADLKDENIKRITEYIADPSVNVKVHALSALGLLGDKARPARTAITNALNAPEGIVQASAITCLAALGDVSKSVLPELLKSRKTRRTRLRKPSPTRQSPSISGVKKVMPGEVEFTATDWRNEGFLTPSLLDATFRRDGGKLLAALIRGCGDFDRAEDALQDAVTRALATWPRDGVPDNPAAWLLAVARRVLVDKSRRAKTVPLPDLPAETVEVIDPQVIPDERLRLLFTCCQPALSQQAQVALALRTLGGLTTREIARAFVEPEATCGPTVVRAKQKIREARIPFEVPAAEDLPERLAAVLEVIYLVFNEGYAATSDPGFLRPDLCDEAGRLAKLLADLIPDEPEPRGLLALVLLHNARRATRLAPDGSIVPLEEQDRSAWDREMIQEGVSILDSALPMSRPGPYQIQAAVAALHATAATSADTDWPQIAALYAALVRFTPTPVVQLNAAVAHALAGHFDSGLDWIDQISTAPELKNYYLLPAAKADLLRRAGRLQEASTAYRTAIPLATTDAERKYLERRLAEVTG